MFLVLLFTGFFCPEGSTTPVPCPRGTFRSEGAALTPHSCLACPVDFFNPMPGQKACLPCGSEAAQPTEGQETCICLGKGQVFQVRGQFCSSCSVLMEIAITSDFGLHSFYLKCTNAGYVSLTGILQSCISFPFTYIHRAESNIAGLHVSFRATSIPLLWECKGGLNGPTGFL